MKLELNDDFNELEGAVRVVGKVRTEEKAKQKDRLLRAQDLLERPLGAFANCVRCDVGNPQTQYVQDGLDLWEAAARWVSILLHSLEMGANQYGPADAVCARRPGFVGSSCSLGQYTSSLSRDGC